MSLSLLSPPVTFSSLVPVSPGAHALPGHVEGSSQWVGSIRVLDQSGPEEGPLGWQDGGGHFKGRVWAVSRSVFLEPDPGESESGSNPVLFKVRNVGGSRLPSGGPYLHSPTSKLGSYHTGSGRRAGFRLAYLVMARDTMASCCLGISLWCKEGTDVLWAAGSILIRGFLLESSLQNPRSLCIRRS